MRAREVREMLQKDDSTSPTVQFILEALAEEQNAMGQALHQLGEMQNQLIDLVGNFAVVGENMKNVVEKVMGKPGEFDE
tara:strand:- start:173 stop:409 length:237 start_codon:yes stop_codon:yes gene_type:complete